VARWTPCKRSDFIRKLRRLGFSVPETGGRHAFMRHALYTLTLPSNPEYSVPQLRVLLREVEQGIGRGVTLDDWLAL
jgi:predicted RNA binding protein YcfA (HicA-like mRNA interferase family)